MLLQFNFKNYKSFKNETCLDMRATSISEHKDRIFSEANEKALPIAAIYGANAHGKSNVFSAFKYMKKYVIRSLSFGGEDNDREDAGNIEQDKEYKFLRPIPFLLDELSSKSESLFEVYFTRIEDSREKIYCYGFTINSEGVNEEWLNSKTKTSKKFKKIFYRDKDVLELDGIPKNSRENIKLALEKETLVVTLGSKLKIQVLKNVRDWFKNNIFVDFGEPIENLLLSTRIRKDFVEDEKVRNDVVKYLSAFDDSIVDFSIEKNINDKDDRSIKVYSVHKKMNSNDVVKFPLKFESAGTQKMFSLYPLIKKVIDNGGVLVIDELNSRLHPLLVRNILLAFFNPEINKNKAQLIFTSHDIWHLTDNVLRRDEIWFSKKDSDGVSTLYSLYDFYDDDGNKIRKDENYQKNYLLGKYGAIPRMKDFVMFKED